MHGLGDAFMGFVGVVDLLPLTREVGFLVLGLDDLAVGEGLVGMTCFLGEACRLGEEVLGIVGSNGAGLLSGVTVSVLKGIAPSVLEPPSPSSSSPTAVSIRRHRSLLSAIYSSYELASGPYTFSLPNTAARTRLA